VSPFKPLRFEKFAQEVAKRIKASIFDGIYASGDRLPTESALAEMFNVSKVTIRQAVRILENSGILFTRQGVSGGIFVSEADTTSVSSYLSDMLKLKKVTQSDLTMTRLIFEPDVAAFVTRVWSDEDLKDIRVNIEQAETAFRKGNLYETRIHNLAFHRLICAITKNPVIIFSLNSVIDVLEENVLTLKLSENFVLNEIRAHEVIIEKIELRQIDECREIMRRHIREVHERLESEYLMFMADVVEKQKRVQRQ